MGKYSHENFDHSQPIKYTQARNVLVSSEFVLKVSDFGLAKSVKEIEMYPLARGFPLAVSCGRTYTS